MDGASFGRHLLERSRNAGGPNSLAGEAVN